MATGDLTSPGPGVAVPATTTGMLDEAVAVLRGSAPRWAATGIPERLELLRALSASTLDASRDWVEAAVRIRGMEPERRARAEEWGSGIVPVLRQLKFLEVTLADIAATGRPQPPAVRTDPGSGQVTVEVFPTDRLDRMLFPGFTAEVRVTAGVSREQALARMGRIYREGSHPGPGVALVLGAGNVSSIGPLDVLHQLFAEGRVVLLKMHPVNSYLGPHLAEAFAPLVSAGHLRIVYGGADTGSYLTDHDDIDAIHLTGTDATHDAIVFGSGDDGLDRKARGEARPRKPLSAGLGNVTPVIVVPGPWSDTDLTYHGHNIASMLAYDAGFTCAAPRVVVQHRAWSRRQALLEAIRTSLRSADVQASPSPGAVERWTSFTRAHTTAEWFGEPVADRVPLTLIPDLDPGVADDIAFTTEAFCGIMGEVALDTAHSVTDFLEDAVAFCNETLWGTLAATIIVHPRSLADPEVAAAVESAIDGLEYGSVVVNHFPGVAFAFASTPWGAAPGAAPDDIRSGRGFVHNTYLLEDVAKSVVRGPFRAPMKPPWFHTHRTAHELLPKVARLTATGELSRLPGLLWSAVRG